MVHQLSRQNDVQDVQNEVRRAVRLQADGRLAEAVDAYRDILQRHPETGACWANLGAALRALGRKEEGLGVLREGVRVCPGVVGLHYNLGNALTDAGAHEEALEHYRTAFVRGPRHVKAARACGAVLLHLERFDDAVDHYRAALDRHPDDAALVQALGTALARLREYRPAAAALRRALALGPPSTACRLLLYRVLAALGRYAEGERELRPAAAADPRALDVLAALGQNHIDQGRLEAGLACCDAALAIDDEHVDALLGRARANFLAGRYAAAWPDYAARRRVRTWRGAQVTGRAWAGQALDGQSIVLYGEQGLGDVIQFARFAPLLARRGADVSLYCAPRLVRLLARLPGVRRVLPADRPCPPADWVCPLLDVPAVLGTDLDAIPRDCPYLTAPARPRPVLPPARRFRVGFVWAGNPAADSDRRRSCRLEDFAPLFDVPGAEFVSFQVGPRARDLRAGWRAVVHDPGAALTDLEATADALLEVDLVVTVDTMLAHLAGALGRPVWTLLAFAPDWRWMLGRADTPWYPTMRLFRQPAPNDWAGVFDEVRRELAARLAAPGRDASPPGGD